MTAKTALLGLALLVPTSALYSADAAAFAKCDAMDDEKSKAKCEKKEGKRISKLRSKTTAYTPSSLNENFAGLDAEDTNPLNTDDYYTAAYEPLNIAAVDQVLGGVARIEAALTMATYIGALEKEGKSDEAKSLATNLLPELVKMKDEVQAIKEGVEKIKADPASLVKENPMAAPKVVAGAGAALGKLPGIMTDLPKAVSAIKPLAGGAAGAAVQSGMDKANDAAGGAMDKVDDAKQAAPGN